MPGNVIGGRKAAATNKARHGDDFYANLGRLAQKKWRENGRKPRGFAAVPGLAERAGAIGGRRSRRTKKPSGLADV